MVLASGRFGRWGGGMGLERKEDGPVSGRLLEWGPFKELRYRDLPAPDKQCFSSEMSFLEHGSFPLDMVLILKSELCRSVCLFLTMLLNHCCFISCYLIGQIQSFYSSCALTTCFFFSQNYLGCSCPSPLTYDL